MIRDGPLDYWWGLRDSPQKYIEHSFKLEKKYRAKLSKPALPRGQKKNILHRINCSISIKYLMIRPVSNSDNIFKLNTAIHQTYIDLFFAFNQFSAVKLESSDCQWYESIFHGLSAFFLHLLKRQRKPTSLAKLFIVTAVWVLSRKKRREWKT